MTNAKRQNGQYYTEGNPFVLEPFKKWAEKAGLQEKTILEPFAGANNIIRWLQTGGYAGKFAAYDIHPADKAVTKQDTIKNFPAGFAAVVTNPPWLAKNSAKRRGLYFPPTKHDDLYKHCLELCLQNCVYVGALIPATFLQSSLFRERLDTFIVLHDKRMFSDTENPVALALFGEPSRSVEIFYDNKHIGELGALQSYLPVSNNKIKVKFNVPGGKLGFIAFDNTKEPTIRFCRGERLDGYQMKISTRMITRIDLEIGSRSLDKLIGELNKDISEYREKTGDIFLTPFKGLRSDGMYRRRMNYAQAKAFISKQLCILFPQH